MKMQNLEGYIHVGKVCTHKKYMYAAEIII
jgi:hypothetical protein